MRCTLSYAAIPSVPHCRDSRLISMGIVEGVISFSSSPPPSQLCVTIEFDLHIQHVSNSELTYNRKFHHEFNLLIVIILYYRF